MGRVGACGPLPSLEELIARFDARAAECSASGGRERLLDLVMAYPGGLERFHREVEVVLLRCACPMGVARRTHTLRVGGNGRVPPDARARGDVVASDFLDNATALSVPLAAVRRAIHSPETSWRAASAGVDDCGPSLLEAHPYECADGQADES